jgi:hypothetical protein
MEDFMYNTLGFTDKQSRDEEWAKRKATGERGVVRYTTHDQNHPQIVYVLAYPVVSNLPQSDISDSTSPEVPLTKAIASGMLDDGGNTDANETIQDVAGSAVPETGSNQG